jgi:hypothetical protein
MFTNQSWSDQEPNCILLQYKHEARFMRHHRQRDAASAVEMYYRAELRGWTSRRRDVDEGRGRARQERRHTRCRGGPGLATQYTCRRVERSTSGDVWNLSSTDSGTGPCCRWRGGRERAKVVAVMGERGCECQWRTLAVRHVSLCGRGGSMREVCNEFHFDFPSFSISVANHFSQVEWHYAAKCTKLEGKVDILLRFPHPQARESTLGQFLKLH